MNRDPKRLEHPKAVYLIGLFVMFMILFVLGGVVNHFALSSHGPGLLVPLVEKFQEKESPDLKAFRELRSVEEHQHFHHFVDSPETPAPLRSTCYICHSKLPHSKTKKIRSMLNMHSNYFTCEACHLEIKEGETISYKWYSGKEENPQGPFFGTSYDPDTGELQKVRNHDAKIAPFLKKDNRLECAIELQQGEEARKYMNIREGLTPEQKKELTNKFHVYTRLKGPECHICHNPNGILDFKALQFTPKRITDLENLSIKGIITKYDEFYLPDLFKQSEDLSTNGMEPK